MHHGRLLGGSSTLTWICLEKMLGKRKKKSPKWWFDNDFHPKHFPVSMWLINMVIVSALAGVVPVPNGRTPYKWWLLTYSPGAHSSSSLRQDFLSTNVCQIRIIRDWLENLNLRKIQSKLIPFIHMGALQTTIF